MGYLQQNNYFYLFWLQKKYLGLDLGHVQLLCKLHWHGIQDMDPVGVKDVKVLWDGAYFYFSFFSRSIKEDQRVWWHVQMWNVSRTFCYHFQFAEHFHINTFYREQFHESIA